MPFRKYYYEHDVEGVEHLIKLMNAISSNYMHGELHHYVYRKFILYFEHNYTAP